MGAIGDALSEYARPLLEQTDGSVDDLNKAMQLSMMCYNLALLPGDKQDEMLSGMQGQLNMDDVEFQDFKDSLVLPMIRRHHEMFPQMSNRRGVSDFVSDEKPIRASRQTIPVAQAPKAPAVALDPYASCPCNSGKKYKFCCRIKKN